MIADAPDPPEPAGRWRLWRQDDHGNTVPMREFATEAEADAACAEFAARGHHQHYWVEREPS